MLTPTVIEIRRHGQPLRDVLPGGVFEHVGEPAGRRERERPKHPAPVRLHGLVGHRPGLRYRTIDIAARDRRDASLLSRR